MYIDSGNMILNNDRFYRKAQELQVVKTPETFTDRELTRALRDAIIAENGAIKQYETVVDSSDKDDVKEILQSIADEEKVHVGELQELLRKLLSDEQEFLDKGAKEVEENLSESASAENAVESLNKDGFKKEAQIDQLQPLDGVQNSEAALGTSPSLAAGKPPEQIVGTFMEFANGGRANEKGITETDVDPQELAAGTEIELEHTTDENTARRIALDHLSEFSDYYTRLKKMEEEAKAAAGDLKGEVGIEVK